MTETDGDSVVISDGTSRSTSSSSGTSSSSSSSSTASSTGTGEGDAYGEETNQYDNYDGYGTYNTYYDESTAAPDGDTSRRVTVTSIGTGGELDLGAGGNIDLAAGTGIERNVITSGGATSVTITTNKTSVG